MKRATWIANYSAPYLRHLADELAAGRISHAQAAAGTAAKLDEAARTWRKRKRIHGPQWPDNAASRRGL